MMQRVGVVGMGLLGRGIAACMLGGGLEVIVYDRDRTMRDDLESYLESTLEEIREHRPESAEGCVRWRERFRWAMSLREFAPCSLVIESVSESLEVKRTILFELEAVVQNDAILASNTSAIPITELQRGLAHPARVAGMHWSEPAFATRFLEIIAGDLTVASVTSTLREFGLRLNKEPCVLNDLPGFIVNRLGYAMYREAANLLEMGVADAETIDRAYRNAAGLWASFCGPFRWIDITGGAELYAKAMERVLPQLASEAKVPAAIQRQAESDRAKSGSRQTALTGFYNETDETKLLWLELLHRHAWEIEDLRRRMDETMIAKGLLKKLP